MALSVELILGEPEDPSRLTWGERAIKASVIRLHLKRIIFYLRVLG
jgi:hypothetical protein